MYNINGPDYAHRKREALMAALNDEAVPGDNGERTVEAAMGSRSMIDELDDLDQYLHSGVE